MIPGLDLHVPAACDSLRSTPNAVTVRVRIRHDCRCGLWIAHLGRIFRFAANDLRIVGDVTVRL